jgi:hypothetical protein
VKDTDIASVENFYCSDKIYVNYFIKVGRVKIIIVIFLIIFMISCAHHRDVSAGARGTFIVAFQTQDKTSGYGNAKSQADHYCQGDSKRAYILKEGYKYTGKMKEKAYRYARMASKVAKGVRTSGYGFSREKNHNTDRIIGLGGELSDNDLPQGYTYHLFFQCISAR